jgi:2-C-methyl-D-erythritol 4-phosphate cytidylyltransferase
VHIIEGNTDNIKITTSKDIAIAEKLIIEEDAQ